MVTLPRWDWGRSTWVDWREDEYDPYMHDRRDEPPELDDADWPMAMYDPNLGWLDV